MRYSVPLRYAVLTDLVATLGCEIEIERGTPAVAAPFDMPDNYSSLGGYSFNPYDPRRDPRPRIGGGMPVLSPGGSSSGIGASANLWVANVSDEIDPERDRERYEADRAKDIELTGARGIDAAVAEHGLDALLFPAPRGANVAARPGYPTVIVPLGLVPNEAQPAFPAGFEPQPAPFGVSFAGPACSEPRLIALAYAFGQATRRRIPPPGAP